MKKSIFIGIVFFITLFSTNAVLAAEWNDILGLGAFEQKELKPQMELRMYDNAFDFYEPSDSISMDEAGSYLAGIIAKKSEEVFPSNVQTFFRGILFSAKAVLSAGLKTQVHEYVGHFREYDFAGISRENIGFNFSSDRNYEWLYVGDRAGALKILYDHRWSFKDRGILAGYRIDAYYDAYYRLTPSQRIEFTISVDAAGLRTEELVATHYYYKFTSGHASSLDSTIYFGCLIGTLVYTNKVEDGGDKRSYDMDLETKKIYITHHGINALQYLKIALSGGTWASLINTVRFIGWGSTDFIPIGWKFGNWKIFWPDIRTPLSNEGVGIVALGRVQYDQWMFDWSAGGFATVDSKPLQEFGLYVTTPEYKGITIGAGLWMNTYGGYWYRAEMKVRPFPYFVFGGEIAGGSEFSLKREMDREEPNWLKQRSFRGKFFIGVEIPY